VGLLFRKSVSFGSIDVDHVPVAKTEFDFRDLPMVVILRDGIEIKRFYGVQSEKTLASELNAITGDYSKDVQGEIVWEEMLDREREIAVLHKQILVIDDDPDITFCIITILKEARFDNILIAGSYEDAVTQFRLRQPNLIFLNVTMQNKEGNKILLTLRKNSAWRKIPILVSVGPLEPTRVYEDSFREATILRHGKYVEHPCTRDSFVSLVRNMLLGQMKDAESQSRLLNINDVCSTERTSM
jgi:CheY-like chemotaxis protein